MGTVCWDVIKIFLLLPESARFLHASAMLKHVIDVGWTYVSLSVCHTLVLYQNG